MISFNKHIWANTALILLLISNQVLANVSATLNLPSECFVGESCEVEVVVQGSRGADEPQIQTPPGLELSYRGASTSMSYISGQGSSSSVTFAYDLIASRTGQFVIGPATVHVDGTDIKAEAKSLKVLQNGTAASEDRYFFVEATATPNAAYVGQQVIYSFRFYNRARINNAEYKAPSFDKFWKEDMGKQKEYRQGRDGYQWDVTELNYALFPSSRGDLIVDPVELTVNAIVQSKRRSRSFFDDGFFGSEIKKIKLTTEPTLIKAIDLPPPPAGFEKTALVGRFSAQAALSKNEGKVGDSITLTIVLEGHGNIWNSKLLNIELPQIKAYADKPTLTTKVGAEGIWGRRVFKFALVPKEAGAITIAPVQFTFFDPKDNAYKHASTQELTLQVAPTDEEEKVTHVKANPAVAKNEIQVLGTDLMPPHWGELSQDALNETESLALWVVLGLCPVSYLVALAWRRRRDILMSDPNYIRGKKALSELRAKVKALEKSSHFYEELATAIRLYVTHRLGLEAQGMTSADVERILAPKGLSKESIDLAKHLISESERGQYGGHHGGTNHNKTELLQKLQLFSNQVEKEC